MAIIAKGDVQGEFELAPEGMFLAVCVDVVDMGIVENPRFHRKDGSVLKQHKVRLVFALDELRSDGRTHLIGKQFTLSLSEKSKLRPFLESWRGKRFTEDELKGFDLEVLLGKSCNVTISHDTGKDGRTWANIVSISGLVKGQQPLEVPATYVRKHERDEQQDHVLPPTDLDDIPF